MIELTDWLREELGRRTEQEAPWECCGLISRATRGTRVLPPSYEGSIGLWAAENVAEEPETSFLILPADQAEILRQIWGRGEELVGVYHSHPRSGPEPSDRDREIAAAIEAARPDAAEPLTWVIIGLPPCPYCNGGYVTDVEPECCGNTTSSGECRGDCAVPRQVELPCPSCGGEERQVAFWVGTLT